MPNVPRIAAGRFRPELLFRPASVAVVGAGTRPGGRVMANLLAAGFGGAILPVGAGQAAVSGVLAYPDVAAMPIAPDLALVCAEPAELSGMITALGRRGTLAAVVMGLGSGLRELALATGVRSLGPGSFGIAVPSIGLNASCAHLPPRPGRIALVSQSAALCRAVLDWAGPNGVGFSHVVGIGGNDDLGFAVALDWLSRDPGTGAILLDIRRIKDRRAFLSAGRAAARLRPTVAIRAGARLMDPSGEAEATFVAALRRCGILTVTTVEDLLAAAETLTRSQPTRGESLAIVTNAVGPAHLAADAVLRDGLRLAVLSPQTRAAIAALLPRARTDAGDIIHAGIGAPDALTGAARVLSDAPEVGGVLIVHAPAGPTDVATIAAIAAAAIPRALVAAMGETTGAAHRRQLAEAGIPAFATPEQAVRGFLHLVQDRRNRAAARELPASTVLDLAPDRAEIRRLLAGGSPLTQHRALALLAQYGLPLVPGHPAADAKEAVAAAARLGYPVVLRRSRLGAAHATGGTVLDLRDAAELRAACALLARLPGEPGFLVQRQVPRARELRIAVGEDAVFGPTIALGPGGAGGHHHAAIDLPPLNLSLARALIARAGLADALGPWHDHEAADGDAVADALVRVSQLVVDCPDIAGIEIAPLFADPAGIAIADATIALRAPGEAPGRLAISPYPAELAGTFATGGETLAIRPIRPEDAEAHENFFRRLPPEDIRYRFFSPLRQLSAQQMARLTQIDYDREMAFIASRPATGETVGVARLVRDSLDGGGEFAIAVEPAMKGRGVARHLMERLLAWARDQGLPEVSGHILADNAPMIAFIRRLGFALHRSPGDAGVLEARLKLV